MNDAAQMLYGFFGMLLLWGAGLFVLLYLSISIFARISRWSKQGTDGYGTDSLSDERESARGFEAVQDPQQKTAAPDSHSGRTF